MAKKDNETNYRAERKQRLAKAAKQKSKKKADSTDVIVGIVKAIVVLVVIGIVCGALYAYGVPQSVLPAMKVGDRSYTMSEYSYYYSSVFQTYANTAYSYVSQYGINLSGFEYTKSPADQTTKDDDGNEITWDQFFRNQVQQTLETYNYYLDLADEQGVTLSDESKKQIDDDIAEIASTADGYSFSTSSYISYMFGKGLNEKKLRSLLEDQYLVAQMIEQQEDELKAAVTMEDIEALYNEDPSDYLAVDLRLFGITIASDEETDETAEEAAEEPSEEAAEEPSEEAAEEPSDEAAEEPSEETVEEPTETEEKEPSPEELLANEMLSKITDENSFIELCKEYCAEDQRETFEDPSASLAIGIKKTTVKDNIDENLAEWLFSDEREVGDKTVCVTDQYAYVIMIKQTAYRDETPLASARHILVSFDGIATAEAAEETENTESEETENTEAEAAENNEEAASADVLTASDGTEIKAQGTYSAETVLRAYEKALQIYNTYKSGEQTEDAFAKLAEEFSDDTASLSEGEKTSGGLYEDVQKGQYVEQFEGWIYDESRQPGDVGIIQTTYGFHIMYFVSRHDEAQWIETIRSKISSEKLEEYEDGIEEEVKGTASSNFITKLAGDEAIRLLEKLYGF